MAEFSKYLGESIYRNRKRQKMTQAELAEKAGVTEQTIRKSSMAREIRSWMCCARL